jgi:hypothetical protein
MVTMIRNKARIRFEKERIEVYRNFMNGFELPNKLKRRTLRKGNRHNIKNLNNFQYSLGQQRAMDKEKNGVNINGLKGDLTQYVQPLNLDTSNLSFWEKKRAILQAKRNISKNNC